MERIKLFCLPYAGGSALVYSSWKNLLNNRIELHPIELAGRGRRSKESFYESMEEAIDDLYSGIEKELDGTDFAFFGHSMGSVLVYELIYKIKQLKKQTPVHAFFSGRYPPHVKKKKEFFHKRTDAEFLKEIRRVGGTPDEFFENSKLLELFLPILKADYKIIENYNYSTKSEKFAFDITVFNGCKDDMVKLEDLEEWQEVTKMNCNVIEFDGGHFFIFEKKKNIVSIINDTICI